MSQADIEMRGWAIECRITAEDAEMGFLPSTGRVSLLSEPSGPGVRVDSSLFPGYEVSQYYDSLLSKLIVWGRDRDEALRRLRRALKEYEVLGIKTTIPFHRRLAADPAFAAGDMDTRFLERRFEMAPNEGLDDGNADNALLAAALLSHSRRAASGNGTGKDAAGAWRSAARQHGVVRPPGGGSWRSTS
jgi:acetyl/propionyl-CoA carboxylase alpha subunit